MSTPRLKRLLRPLAIIGGTGVLLAALGFVEHSAGRAPLTGLNVSVKGAPGVHFIDEEAVRTQVLADAGVIGTPVRDVDVTAIENGLRSIGCVAKADVYRTMDGVLHVQVDQREPVARVINADGSGFYIGRDGYTMPLSSVHTARVLVFTGALHEPFGRSVTDLERLPDSLAQATHSADMLRIARTIAADPLWNALFEQAVLDAEGGFELITRVGVQRIRIGQGEQLAQRLEKLRTFYHQGIAQTDWRRYAIIDLRFGDQVVCTKRTTS
jgi:cell division protein FtsQ